MSNNSPSKQSAPMKYNALKHGLFTKEALLPFENRRDYLRFRRNVIASLNPDNDLERHVAMILPMMRGGFAVTTIKFLRKSKNSMISLPRGWWLRWAAYPRPCRVRRRHG
jgi:hypothetical protein